MVRRALKLGWLWVALYAIGGAFCLVYPLALWLKLGTSTAYLFSVGVACFGGALMVSRFADGDSIREGMLAGLLVTASITLVSCLEGIELQTRVLTLTHFVSTVFLAIAGAQAGGRAGALWGRRFEFEGEGKSGPVLAALVLIGAFACHAALVTVVAVVSHGLGVFLCLITIFVTPAFAGAALQLGQSQAVERQVGMGIALIAGTLLCFVAWELKQFGSLSAVAVAFLGVGATIYSIALPGVMTVRSSRFWSHRCNEVPQAVVVQGVPESN
jgi:hypothetical protein